jgi:PIN domain nuclease of toxin-antitoxin system
MVVERVEDAAISTVNWSEIVRRLLQREVQVNEVRARLADASVVLVPFDEFDADRTAALWSQTRRLGLSLADRACLALAGRLGVPAVTADRAWSDLDVGVEILCIR